MAGLTFGFDASDPKSYEAMQLRQRMAMAMMSGKKGYPKNVGEGLTAIGDSLGDIGMARRLEATQAAMDRAAAARAAGVTGAAPFVPPKAVGTDPSAALAPTTQTASAEPDWLSGAQVQLPPPQQTAEVSPQLPPTAPVQDASVVPPPAEGSFPQTAAADTGTLSDAPVIGGQPTAPPDPALRARVAQTLQARQGVPPQNPLLGGGQSPAAMPSIFSPADLGSPLEAANNPPREMPNIQLAQAQQPYQRGTLREVPITGIKPPSAASEPVPPNAAEPRYQTPGQFSKPPVFSPPPLVPDKSPQQAAAERELINPMNSPSDRQRMQDIITIEQKKRDDAHKQAMEAWNVKKALTESEYQKERDRVRSAAQLEVEQQKREQERQASDYKERITRHLGGRDPAAIETNLYKSRASIGNTPAIVQAISRTNAVVDKMYTGPTADVNTFLSQLLPQTPFFDPSKGAATQQFRSAMTDIVAAHRAAVVGSGAQSGPELALLLRASAADAKLDVATIKESLQAAERLMIKTAIAHQKEVHDYAGNFDPDRTRSVFSSFGVPGIEDVVPQRTITKLLPYANDKKAKDDFDETYHTPGLADKLIQRELLRQQRTPR